MNENKSAMEAKLSYIKNADLGTIVAFISRSGKAKSAKIIGRDVENEVLEVETSYGAKFKIDFSDVIWVRTGKRWPKGVYELLKGIANEDQ